MKVLSVVFLIVFLQACSEKPVQKINQPNFEQSQDLFDELDKEMEKN